VGAGLALALFYFVLGYRAHLRNQRVLDQVEALGAEVQAARAAADGCVNDLAMAESLFRQTQADADSLKAQVEAAEQPLPGGGRGVDAQAYETYMADVGDYNAAVERWEAQGEEVEARDQECRALVERHNLLLDSLRALMAEHGLES
jgi:hypothetical protein